MPDLAWNLGTVIIGALMIAAAVRTCRKASPLTARTRTSRAERRLRHVLNMPPHHPERIYGGDRAAERGDFPAWLAELARDGIDAGQIIREERR